MRRFLVVALAATLSVLGCVVWGGGAASAYPVTTSAQLAVSTTSPYVGEAIEVSGAGFHASESVQLSIGGTLVGTAHTDASGNFDPPITTPNLLGRQTLTGAGASGESASVVLTIRAKSGPSQGVGGVSVGPSQGAGAAGGHDSGSGGGLPFTGVPLIALIVLALALIGGGAAFTVSARRRGTSSARA